MREIVLDTETTGFEPTEGDRIVEIGAVELFNHMPTGRTYHQYINPERTMPKAAFEVQGLCDDFLRDKPVFREIGQAFLPVMEHLKLEKARGGLRGVILTSDKKTFLSGGDLEYLLNATDAEEIFSVAEALKKFPKQFINNLQKNKS